LEDNRKKGGRVGETMPKKRVGEKYSLTGERKGGKEKAGLEEEREGQESQLPKKKEEKMAISCFTEG